MHLKRHFAPAAVGPGMNTRTLYMLWADSDEGWLASLHGATTREHMEWRLDQETKENGNRHNLRIVRVTVHTGEEEPK